MADTSGAVGPGAVLDARSAESLNDDQLHERACWRNPSCPPPYVSAGHVYSEASEPGAPLGWAVVACARHREAA